MVTFEFIKISDGILYFRYFPNGKGRPGEISISQNGSSMNIVNISPDDYGTKCAGKVALKIRDYLLAGEDVPSKGMVAWG